MILRHVFRGMTSRVNACPRSLNMKICRATENDKHAIATFDDIERLQFPFHYQSRHARSWARDNGCRRLEASLAIFLSCQQLDTEAARLPFSQNRFAFEGSDSRKHDTFLSQLRPFQRSAMFYAHFGPQVFYHQLPFGLMHKLPGLREVVLLLKDDTCELTSADGLSGDRTD